MLKCQHLLKAQNYDIATSLRYFLLDNCLLTLEDDDNDTLDLVSDELLLIIPPQTIILYMI